MNKAEILNLSLHQSGCEVIYSRISHRVKGVYIDEPDAPYIVLDPHLTNIEKVTTLAHEAGHHYKGLTGHSGRDEERANRWAVDYLLSPSDIVSATLRGAQSYHELADMLHLEEDFVRQSVAIFAVQFGPVIKLERHTLHLHPIWVEDRLTGQTWPAE